jgi:AcrR family transcriptional regulator
VQPVSPRQGQPPAAAPAQASRRPVGLDADAIVAAALALIDERGTAAFTIRDLGARLGVSAPTIYWHAGSKAQLFETIVNRVVADMAITGRGRGPWDERLRRFVGAARTQLLAHPGVMELMRSVHSPAFERWATEALGIMRDAGFGDRDAAAYARTALLHAIGCAQLEATARTVRYLEPVPGAAGGRARRVKPELLPENLAPGVALMTSYDLDQQHQIMTDVLIDGVRAALARAGAR